MALMKYTMALFLVGFQGIYMADKDNTEKCKTDTCKNGGECVDGINGYTCNCDKGRNIAGDHCEVKCMIMTSDMCYWREDKGLPWEEAAKACASHGAHLAVIKSKEQDNAIGKLAYETNSLYWIGLSRETGCSPMWVTGEPLGSYTNYLNSPPYYIPDLLKAEKGCAAMYGRTKQWAVDECSWMMAYICQYQLK